jgi:hypothetical protein
LASIIVSGSAAVYYDGRTLYPGATVYAVEDTYENYVKYVADAADSLVTISEAFTDTLNSNENHLEVTVDFSTAAAKSIATHRVFDVTGLVRMKITPVCTTNLVASANTAVIAFGTAGGASQFIGGTSAELIDAGEIWADSSPTETNLNYSSAVIDKVVFSQAVGYEIATAVMSTGVITFICDWTAMNATGNVTAGNLSAMA